MNFNFYNRQTTNTDDESKPKPPQPKYSFQKSAQNNDQA